MLKGGLRLDSDPVDFLVSHVNIFMHELLEHFFSLSDVSKGYWT